MAAGNDTGPHPITSPFDWGLGSASVPPAAVPTPVAPAAPPPLLRAPVPVPGVPAAVAPSPAAAEPAITPPVRRPETYFTSDSDDDVDPASPIAPLIDLPVDSIFVSPIDSLFGETQFKDYEGEPLVGPLPTGLNPFAGAFASPSASASPSAATPTSANTSVIEGVAAPVVATVAAPPSEPGAPFSKNQKLLFWLSGGVIALLVLAILFVIGTKIAAAPTPAASSKSATPKVVPSSSAGLTPSATGPAAAGLHLWSDLRGGECVDPYSNPFDLRFTVVDCAAPHPAQMVFRGTFPGEATVAYPGLDSLQSQITSLCTAPGVIDLAKAGAYSDIQFRASFAATTEEWTKGQHDYFCFVNRSGGEPITGSLAGTQAK